MDLWSRGPAGYDPATRALRLTSDAARTRDAEERPLGYRGRAHPIVRRALDRVRNQQFGHGGGQLDRRATAVRGDGNGPALLFRFLAAVTSGAGREYERVLAVQVGRDGSVRTFTDPAAWEALAKADRQVPTAGVWERHFAAWPDCAEATAQEAAAAAFAPLAADLATSHAVEIARERAEIDSWVASRAEGLCGVPASSQVSLFETAPERPSWQTMTDPIERLATFHTDASVPLARRREAEGVLSLRTGRLRDLERRATLGTPAPALLGMLMLVPGAGG